jgi:hypothetical protein
MMLEFLADWMDVIWIVVILWLVGGGTTVLPGVVRSSLLSYRRNQTGRPLG